MFKTGTHHGALLVLAGMAVIGLIDNFVVEIAKLSGLWQFHFIRAVMALPMLVILGLVLGHALLPQRYWAVGLRSVLLASAMLLYFGSIPAMPIALVIAGLFTSPVFVLIFSALFFGTRVGIYRIAAVAVGFTGVLLVLNPFGADFTPRLILPVLGGALYALNAIVARRYCAQESTVAMLIGFFLTLGLLGAAGLVVLGRAQSVEFLARGWVDPGMPFLAWTFVQAFGSIIGVGLLTRAYQSTETTYLVVFEYSLLLFASFWAFILYGQTVGWMAALGMALIVASGVIIALRNGPDPA